MWDNIRPVFIITRREVRDQFRDWRIIIPIIILTLFFPGLMNFTAQQAVEFVGRYGAPIIGDRLIPFLLMIVGFFPISVSLVIALESFVGEKERGSIEPLLATPLTDWQLYLGKLIAVMVPPVIASYVGICVYLIGVYREIGWVPELELLIQILTLTFVQALVMVSGAVVISTQTTSVRAANLLASFIIIPMSFLIQGESMVMFWGEYHALWWAILSLVIIAGLLIRTGIGYFNREELLGRDLDILNVRWMWREFVSGFKGVATTPWSWVRLELLKSFPNIFQPSLFMIGVIVASLIIGAGQADIFSIPPDMIQLDDFDSNLIEGIENVTLFSAEGIPKIWFQNFRAVVFASILGLFTYGVLGLLVLMFPFFVIGFLLATVAPVGIPVGTFVTAFLLPHGIFEIPAIIFAGAAILRNGAILATKSRGKTIGEGLLHSFADWTKIMLGLVIPLLLLGAIVEALITPKIAAILLSK
jgi:uncharacterized membrane protein SpoIIM required for sporulation/ABC-type transport system involved in multi-copper enzyme maturation permease subunit